MKHLILIATMLFAFTLTAQPANTNKTKSISDDDAQIIKVMKAETKAFYANNYEAWKNQWAQEDNSIVAWNNKDGSYRHMRGWQEINKVFKDMIKNQTEEAHPDFNVGDLDIEINGDMAFTVYNEYVANAENKYSKVPGIKTLKKVNGQWKLHSVISFWDRNYQYSKEQVADFVKDSAFNYE